MSAFSKRISTFQYFTGNGGTPRLKPRISSSPSYNAALQPLHPLLPSPPVLPLSRGPATLKQLPPPLPPTWCFTHLFVRTPPPPPTHTHTLTQAVDPRASGRRASAPTSRAAEPSSASAGLTDRAARAAKRVPTPTSWACRRSTSPSTGAFWETLCPRRFRRPVRVASSGSAAVAVGGNKMMRRWALPGALYGPPPLPRQRTRVAGRRAEMAQAGGVLAVGGVGHQQG